MFRPLYTLEEKKSSDPLILAGPVNYSMFMGASRLSPEEKKDRACWISTPDPFVLHEDKPPTEVFDSSLLPSPNWKHMHARANWACMCTGRTGGIAAGWTRCRGPNYVRYLDFLLFLWGFKGGSYFYTCLFHLHSPVIQTSYVGSVKSTGHRCDTIYVLK